MREMGQINSKCQKLPAEWMKSSISSWFTKNLKRLMCFGLLFTRERRFAIWKCPCLHLHVARENATLWSGAWQHRMTLPTTGLAYVLLYLWCLLKSHMGWDCIQNSTKQKSATENETQFCLSKGASYPKSVTISTGCCLSSEVDWEEYVALR